LGEVLLIEKSDWLPLLLMTSGSKVAPSLLFFSRFLPSWYRAVVMVPPLMAAVAGRSVKVRHSSSV
jgi:hypothetical protein